MIVLLLILAVAGCLALVGTAVDSADKAIKRHEKKVGGVNNPLTIKPGKAFNVRGLNYQAGWKMKNDALGDFDVKKLRVNNTRKTRDYTDVEVKVWKGSEVIATATCSPSAAIAPGTTATLKCLSTDKLPKKFSRVTINDSL